MHFREPLPNSNLEGEEKSPNVVGGIVLGPIEGSEEREMDVLVLEIIEVLDELPDNFDDWFEDSDNGPADERNDAFSLVINDDNRVTFGDDDGNVAAATEPEGSGTEKASSQQTNM